MNQKVTTSPIVNFIILIIVALMVALSSNFVLAIEPPGLPPCDEIEIDKSELLLPQEFKNNVKGWTLRMSSVGAACARFETVSLSLWYTLPSGFSTLGIQYDSHLDIAFYVDSKEVKKESIDLYIKMASEARGAVERAESDPRVIEFTENLYIRHDKDYNNELKDGIVSYLDVDTDACKGVFNKCKIDYAYSEKEVYVYNVPLNMEWNNYPEISEFIPIVKRELQKWDCNLDDVGGTISGVPGDGFIIMGWNFGMYKAGTTPKNSDAASKIIKCPRNLSVKLYDDGTKSDLVMDERTIPEGWIGINKKLKEPETTDVVPDIETIDSITDHKTQDDGIPIVIAVLIILVIIVGVLFFVFRKKVYQKEGLS